MSEAECTPLAGHAREPRSNAPEQTAYGTSGQSGHGRE